MQVLPDWYFLNKNFSYGPFTCDGCYDMVQRSADFIAIVHIKKTANRIYFWHMNKHKAKKKKMNKSDLIGKTGNIYCND